MASSTWEQRYWSIAEPIVRRLTHGSPNPTYDFDNLVQEIFARLAERNSARRGKKDHPDVDAYLRKTISREGLKIWV